MKPTEKKHGILQHMFYYGGNSPQNGFNRVYLFFQMTVFVNKWQQRTQISSYIFFLPSFSLILAFEFTFYSSLNHTPYHFWTKLLHSPRTIVSMMSGENFISGCPLQWWQRQGSHLSYQDKMCLLLTIFIWLQLLTAGQGTM